MIRPAAEEAVAQTKNLKVGVIATQATVSSQAYDSAIKRLNQKVSVFSQACPLLVPFVEEGVLNGELLEPVLRRYLKPLMKHRIDTLILGCTHYPLLRNAIQKIVGKRVKLIDSAPAAVGKLIEILNRKGSIRLKKKGLLQVFVSDLPRNFLTIGSRFLGEPLNDVKVVRFKTKVTVNGKWTV